MDEMLLDRLSKTKITSHYIIASLIALKVSRLAALIINNYNYFLFSSMKGVT
jgi:hypothetical protein